MGSDRSNAWLATSSLTTRAVKQAITGPYTLGRSGRGTATERANATMTHAAALNAELRTLAAAGCPLIEVHEPAATTIGADPAERALFREAHLRLLDGVIGTHLSLAVTGGNADAAGIETILAAPYASLAVDLIAGPDNWRLVAATPGDRGIVCGALPVERRERRWAGDAPLGGRLRGVDRRPRSGARRPRDGFLAGTPVVGGRGPQDGATRRGGTPCGPPRRGTCPGMDPRAVSSRSAALGHDRHRRRPDPSRRRRLDSAHNGASIGDLPDLRGAGGATIDTESALHRPCRRRFMSVSEHIAFVVNGTPRELEVEPRRLLVQALREDLDLTGTHVGCDTSQCGACTVHVDGRAVKSCTMLAVQADGSEIRTIEGLATGDALHPMQTAFWEKHGLQCGFCTPGMIMTAVDLLDAQPGSRPTTRSGTPSRATSAAARATRTSSPRSAMPPRPCGPARPSRA